ncbi:tetratricopeptide repeat protein [Sphingomonas baiyangensis]|uniref:Uncharacterized protein n=1 Tax=Sphingomonas baiyangensis TaxID=2572576 RepID=A0A4U1L160_9SPHN|nr:hypothetical protein [Sphingomonas baiyangensis]TKD50519.1 hypothetical protein FBR43_06890 [Sphingomonas baiyangensis]
MGWIVLAFLGVGAATLLWALRTPRLLWTMLAAGMMLGAAGYAWQGRPMQAGSPIERAAGGGDFDPAIAALRQQMFGRFQYSDSFFAASDALTRSGNLRGAAQIMIAAVRSSPDNLPLWTGLGTALARADGDTLSPAARFAFARARQLNHEHPAPWFFEGLAMVRAGDFGGARPYWARAVAVSRQGSPYRTGIADRLAALDQMIAIEVVMRRQMQGAPR